MLVLSLAEVDLTKLLWSEVGLGGGDAEDSREIWFLLLCFQEPARPLELRFEHLKSSESCLMPILCIQSITVSNQFYLLNLSQIPVLLSSLISSP